MDKKYEITNKEILGRYLEHSSPSVVYDWFERNTDNIRLMMLSQQKPKIELALLNRNDPVIDLALALFSRDQSTRSVLFERGDTILQQAVLTNKHCDYFPALDHLLEAENTDLLGILLQHTEDRLFLVSLFNKKRAFESIGHDYWLRLLNLTIRNSILQYPYSEEDPEWENFGGGFATKLFRAIYGLFESLEATSSNAELLATFVQRLPSINAFHDPLSDMNVSDLLKKWSNSNEEDFVICRTHLANSFMWFSEEFDGFKDSNDIALRMAYYRNENFNKSQEATNELIGNWINSHQ